MTFHYHLFFVGCVNILVQCQRGRQRERESARQRVCTLGPTCIPCLIPFHHYSIVIFVRFCFPSSTRESSANNAHCVQAFLAAVMTILLASIVGRLALNWIVPVFFCVCVFFCTFLASIQSMNPIKRPTQFTIASKHNANKTVVFFFLHALRHRHWQ